MGKALGKIALIGAAVAVNAIPGKSIAWASSSVPSASLAPGSRSAWPTWSIISSASHGLKAALRLHDTKTGPSDRLRPENQRIGASESALPARWRLRLLPSGHNPTVLRGVQFIRV